MDDLLKNFSGFLNETGGNDQFKGALDSVVSEILSKDSLYTPMKNLRDLYPKWLEDNWENQSDEDLEKYNNQLDKVSEICQLFENENKDKNQEEIFNLLQQLQEMGHPPEELMKLVQEKSGVDPNAPGAGAQGNPMDMFGGLGGLGGGAEPDFAQMMASLQNMSNLGNIPS